MELKVIGLLLEVKRHFGDLVLIDSILGALLNHFVHLDEHFSPDSDFIDDFGFLANIMVSVGAKQRTVGADPHSVLNADNLQLSPVLLAHFLLEYSLDPEIFHRLGELIYLSVEQLRLLSVWHNYTRARLLLLCQSLLG